MWWSADGSGAAAAGEATEGDGRRGMHQKLWREVWLVGCACGRGSADGSSSSSGAGLPAGC